MKRLFEAVALFCALVLVPVAPARGQFTLLHSFTGGDSDGRGPEGSLIQSGSTLYGMTYAGGSNDLGTIYQINADGTGLSLLHSFTNGDGFRAGVNGSLIQSGSTLYGMTFTGGGGGGEGTIFKINADGTGFSLLHSFTGARDGNEPDGSLIHSGSTLYGMTGAGGSGECGTIFKINADGTGFSVLHSFTGEAGGDGGGPHGSLIQSGSTLYGMTIAAGNGGSGTIFQINADGTGFSVLHSFTASEGVAYGSLIQSGSTLYGMTANWTGSNYGTIFKINADGTGFRLLHAFTGGASDGSEPWGSLIQSGSTLYGMTTVGGSGGRGTIFQINADGTGFSLLHSFTGGASDGGFLLGSLIQSGSTLYGTAHEGGTNGAGVVYSLALPNNQILGDFDHDGHVTAADVSAMMAALVDLNGYKSANQISAADPLEIGDIDHSGTLTNSDLSALLNLLKTGGGSLAAVPEPSAVTLPLVAAALASAVRLRKWNEMRRRQGRDDFGGASEGTYPIKSRAHSKIALALMGSNTLDNSGAAISGAVGRGNSVQSPTIDSSGRPRIKSSLVDQLLAADFDSRGSRGLAKRLAVASDDLLDNLFAVE
jgi:uncharacterized repeat protein (TIGR03803 family)